MQRYVYKNLLRATQDNPNCSIVGEVKVSYRPEVAMDSLIQVRDNGDVERILRKIWNDDLYYIESFYAIFLNQSLKLLGYSLISTGGVNSTTVDPRLIFQRALLLNASGIILAHNHPSGNINPSEADIVLTKQLEGAAELLSMKIIDHCILTGNDCLSMNAQDLI